MNMLNTTNENYATNLQVQAKTELTNNILEESAHYLKGSQVLELNKTLNKHFEKYEIFIDQQRDLHENYVEENKSIIELYLSNKTMEGLSPKTITFYRSTIYGFMDYVDKHLSDVTSQDVREYLAFKQKGGSNVYADNLRRNLNSFFNTICNEGYIQYNPMAKIKKIKSVKKVKSPYTELEIEKMRNALNNRKATTKYEKYFKIQNLALFELLLSSGIRLNECVQLNKQDINMNNRSFVVLGKGGKERVCYFSVKAQFYLEQLLNFKYTRSLRRYENEEALFLSKHEKNGYRLGGNAIERRIRALGKECGVEAHPHKFRRTFATNLVNKGVPIEQIKELLGHSNIDTTMIYAIIDETQVKYNHNKYAG